ncbi:LysR family transcriptional regulator [Serratia quinivorans]|uniref:LysR family transcriptional regulator n=1 Tax=Serratia quinivorans TaxID=137545 RepID=UPI002E773CC3|nr:LysR family transcriptional regulator [Serratia quinivorans]
MNIDPTLLRTFVAVTETGGFTRAAQQQNLTQSAISHQIRRLEEQIGRQLLHRTTRRLTLTEDGEDLLRHAMQVLHALDAMRRRFESSPVSGVVRFGLTESFLGERLPPLLSQFARTFPAVRLEVNVSIGLDLCGMVKGNELDLAVVMSLANRIEGRLLRRTQLVWVAAETFSLEGTSLPLALFPMPSVSREAGIAALESKAIEWHTAFTSQSQQGLRAAVLAGLGVAVMASGDVAPGMKVIGDQYGLPKLPDIDFTLIVNGVEPGAAAQAFCKILLEMSVPLPAVGGD